MATNSTNKNVTDYKSSIFDRAFVNVIEKIIFDSSVSKRKIFRKNILKELLLAEGSYQNIKNGNRGVPVNKIDHITTILLSKYKVNQRYLKTLSGLMFNETHENSQLNNVVSEPSEVYLTSQHKVDLLQKENEYLKELLKEKERLIDTLNTALEISRKK